MATGNATQSAIDIGATQAVHPLRARSSCQLQMATNAATSASSGRLVALIKHVAAAASPVAIDARAVGDSELMRLRSQKKVMPKDKGERTSLWTEYNDDCGHNARSSGIPRWKMGCSGKTSRAVTNPVQTIPATINELRNRTQ